MVYNVGRVLTKGKPTEIFRQIEERFERMESGQRAVVATTEDLVQAMTRMVQTMSTLRVTCDSVLQEMSELRGCFAGIEAMLIASAAQVQKHTEELAAVHQRLDALERKAS